MCLCENVNLTRRVPIWRPPEEGEAEFVVCCILSATYYCTTNYIVQEQRYGEGKGKEVERGVLAKMSTPEL